MATGIEGILETSLYVDDLDAAEHFYAELLGLEVIISQPGRHVFLRCGPGFCCCLMQPKPSSPQSPTLCRCQPMVPSGQVMPAFGWTVRQWMAWRHGC